MLQHNTSYICLYFYYYAINLKLLKNLFPGATPVFMAAENNHLEVLQVLIEANANIDLANNNGKRNNS